MNNLVLYISSGIPKLPEEITQEKDLKIIDLPDIFQIKSKKSVLNIFLLDTDYVQKNKDKIENSDLPADCIMLYNKNNSPIPINDKFVYLNLNQDFFFNNIVKTIRNLFRQLCLEQQLTINKDMLKEKQKQNRELLQVSLALSQERDYNTLLGLILAKIRKFVNADAGSLYLLGKDTDNENKHLIFKIAQNDSNPTDYSEFIMPLNRKSISGYVALTGNVLNIKDAYNIPKNAEYSFNKEYDSASQYRTKSMLTLPMRNHKNEIIGIIQLINKKKQNAPKLKSIENAEKYVIPFPRDNEPVVLALAAQAAVTLENNLLYQEIETLFEGFVKASVKAIEQRDPTTSGHSNRVATYTVALAKAVENLSSGKYKNTIFTVEQIKELRYASLLHDFGKVGVREHVLVKAKKLYPEQLTMIKNRFAFIQKSIEYDVLLKQFEYLKEKGMEQYKVHEHKFKYELEQRITNLKQNMDQIIQANEPTVLTQKPLQTLEKLTELNYVDIEGKTAPFLKMDEFVKLNIKRGSLDESDRREIESHVTNTYYFLKTIPWTKEMKHVPELAYGHHEKLNGHGYPRGLKSEDLPVQVRMMTISDIYDALTAMDRPYKKAVSRDKALQILQAEADNQHVDNELVKIFIEANIFNYDSKV